MVDSESLRTRSQAWGSFLLCVVLLAAGDDGNRRLRSFVYLFANVSERVACSRMHWKAALGGVSNT